MRRANVLQIMAALACCFVCSQSNFAYGQETEPGAAEAAGVAKQILDDSRPNAERKKLVEENPKLALPIVKAMTAGLGSDSKEEYRRIPWIWRVSVAAGHRNNADEIRSFLEWALPEGDKPLTDWQTVVIGGGMVSGISDTGAFPGERIESIIGGNEQLRARWARALQLASQQADDERIPTPTRYDALRLAAMQPWDMRAGQLLRCLAKDVHPEVQLGAISALGDVNSPHVAQAILSGAEHYSQANRRAMIDALIRDEKRVPALLDAVSAGRLKKTDISGEQAKKLQGVSDETLRTKVREALGGSTN